MPKYASMDAGSLKFRCESTSGRAHVPFRCAALPATVWSGLPSASSVVLKREPPCMRLPSASGDDCSASPSK